MRKTKEGEERRKDTEKLKQYKCLFLAGYIALMNLRSL